MSKPQLGALPPTPNPDGTASPGASGDNSALAGHVHATPVVSASIAANVATSGTTEKQIVFLTLAANSLVAGTTFRCDVFGAVTTAGSATAITFRIRIGSTTLTGNIATTLGPSGSAVTGPFWFTALVTVRTNGASGTVIGNCSLVGQGTSSAFANNVTLSTTAATVAVDTTAQKTIEMTIQCANAGNVATAYDAALSMVRA